MLIKESNSEGLGDQKSKEYRNLAAIFLLSFGVRLLALWLVPEPHLPENAILAYLKGAKILLEGQGFSDFYFPVYTPPFYSMCIAMVTFLFGGDGIVGIKLLQIAADSLTALIIYSSMREVFDAPTGYLSSITWGLYPFAVYSTLYIGTEALYTFFLALWTWFTVRAIRNDKWQYYCGAGAILGLATLTRGTTQFLPLVLPFILIACRKQNPDWLRGYLMSLICFIVVILPWGARNYLVLHEIIPVGVNSMPVFMGSSEPLLTIGDGRENEMSRLYEKAKAKGIVPLPPDRGPAERDGFLRKLALDNYLEQLRTDPVKLGFFMVKKLFRLWYSTESGKNHRIILGVNILIYASAIVGIVAAWRQKDCMTLVLLGLIGYFVFLHWPTLALFRFMMPVMPYVVGFASFGALVVLKQKWPEILRHFQLISR